MMKKTAAKIIVGLDYFFKFSQFYKRKFKFKFLPSESKKISSDLSVDIIAIQKWLKKLNKIKKK